MEMVSTQRKTDTSVQLKSLVIRAQLGDMGAFADLVRKYQRMAWGYACLRCGDAHTAEDIAQEAFIDAYLHLKHLKNPMAFPAWFHTIVKKHINRVFRGKRFTEESFNEARHTIRKEQLPQEQLISNEILRHIDDCLHRLPEKQRITARLHYVEGRKIPEIAEALNIKPAVVRKRLFDARQTLIPLVSEEFIMTETKHMKDLFEHHLSSRMVKRVMEHPSVVNLQGETRVLTMLIVDAKGIGRLFEDLDPAAAVTQLNEFLSMVHRSVLKNDGFLDKIVGDAALAFWGAPLNSEDHALKACTAALEIRAGTLDLCKKWEVQGKPQFTVGIGIHTGEVIIGNFGIAEFPQYTPMGHAMNLTARMERETREHGVDIAITECTAEGLNGRFGLRDLGTIDTEARPEPIRIYELFSK